MIRWDGPLTYAKTESNFTALSSGVRDCIVPRNGPGQKRHRTRPIYRRERRNVRIVSHPPHGKRPTRQGALAGGRSDAVAARVSLTLLDADRTSDCGPAPRHRC